jgi:hypothetical protein
MPGMHARCKNPSAVQAFTKAGLLLAAYAHQSPLSPPGVGAVIVLWLSVYRNETATAGANPRASSRRQPFPVDIDDVVGEQQMGYSRQVDSRQARPLRSCRQPRPCSGRETGRTP